MNNYYKHFKKSFVLKFFTWSIIYSAIVLFLFFLFSKLLWEWNIYFNPIDSLYSWASDNTMLFIVTILISGYFIIGFLLFNKSLKYLDEVVGAIDDIYGNNNELISLSGDLKDVSEKMNSIKFNLKDKEKLAKDEEKRKNDLIIYLAHDLKTPLTSIIGYLTIIKEESDLNDGFRRKYLQISYDKALRLEELINEFFDITRYKLNDIILEKSMVNFSFMMEQIIYEFNPMLIEKNLEIKSNIESDIQLNIDPNKIERVVDNIIRNAINYSYENNEIEICVGKDREFVNISVINKGPTIPNVKIDHIFDEFFRLDLSRSSKTGGAGLGLAIAKSIVVAHDGSIDVRSENEIIEMIVKLPI